MNTHTQIPSKLCFRGVSQDLFGVGSPPLETGSFNKNTSRSTLIIHIRLPPGQLSGAAALMKVQSPAHISLSGPCPSVHPNTCLPHPTWRFICLQERLIVTALLEGVRSRSSRQIAFVKNEHQHVVFGRSGFRKLFHFINKWCILRYWFLQNKQRGLYFEQA